MAASRTYVYTWIDRDARVAFVFYGDKRAPQRIWDGRWDIDSELTDWLMPMKAAPQIDAEHSLLSPTYASQARSFMRMMQQKFKITGYTVLSNRDRDTIKVPRGRQPVFTPRGWFKSVRAAAHALSVSPSLVTLNCQDESKPDWKYDTPENNNG